MQYKRITFHVPRITLSRRVSLRFLFMMLAMIAICCGWYRDRIRLQHQIQMLNERSDSWGVNQVVGPPNCQGSSDDRNAWASATQDGQQEWLILRYRSETVIKAILVHENYCPGALTKVTALAKDGTETVLWEGVDPTSPTAKRGVSELAVTYGEPVHSLKIYLQSKQIPGWNEIDAVGIRDANGHIQWAEEATASSAYGRAPTLWKSGWAR